jgi:hypothetical protein
MTSLNRASGARPSSASTALVTSSWVLMIMLGSGARLESPPCHAPRKRGTQ